MQCIIGYFAIALCIFLIDIDTSMKFSILETVFSQSMKAWLKFAVGFSMWTE